MYVQIKDKLQQQSVERKYEEYKLEEDELLAYKIKPRILVTQDIRRQLLQPESIFFARNEKGHC